MGVPKPARHGAAYRLAVAARVVLAAGGGYAVAALLTAVLSLTLPMARSEAVVTGTLLSFAAMVALVVTVFAMRSLTRAALTVAAFAVVLGGALWLAGGFTGAVAAAS